MRPPHPSQYTLDATNVYSSRWNDYARGARPTSPQVFIVLLTSWTKQRLCENPTSGHYIGVGTSIFGFSLFLHQFLILNAAACLLMPFKCWFNSSKKPQRVAVLPPVHCRVSSTYSIKSFIARGNIRPLNAASFICACKFASQSDSTKPVYSGTSISVRHVWDNCIYSPILLILTFILTVFNHRR